MFYKIGFFVLLALLLAGVFVFVKANPMKNQGAMSWADFYSEDPAATLKFMDENFGIKVTETSTMPGSGEPYHVIKAKGQMWPFAGVMGLQELPNGKKMVPGTMAYLTVKDYTATHNSMIASGAAAVIEGVVIEGMKFGVYTIPGGIIIGIGEYGYKEKK